MTYDFKNLSPLDFERIVCDLLSADWTIKLNTYKAGRDSGIDIQGYTDQNKKIVIQCKHFANSTLSQLKNAIETEIPKIQKLNPKKYYIVTSLQLTPANKEVLFSLIKNYAKNADNNIIDCNNLNQLLNKHKSVERQHFKLWLPSTHILNTIIHSDIHNNSIYSLDEIKKKIILYVPNKSYNDAQEKLNRNNCVIISGIPGIGKTTLAEILILNFIHDNKDAEYVKISNNISEAQKIFNPEKKQIFYYDDFLGQTQLSEKGLEKNEDSALLNFIKQVQKSSNKKIILTTREYILNQAKNHYEKLDRDLSSSQNIEKCIIDLSKYTNQHKALIFYNHLYYVLRENLEAEEYSKIIDNVLHDKNYQKIISHKNYSPRIIEWMTNANNNFSLDNYSQEFIKNLDNPQEIWLYAFEKHISENARYILMILLVSQSISSDDKKQNYIDDILRKLKNTTHIQFKDALKELDGSFINVSRLNDNKKEIHMEFHNPSILDFLKSYIQKNKCDIFNNVLNVIEDFSSLEKIWGTNICDFYDNDKDSTTQKFRKNLLCRYPIFKNKIIDCINKIDNSINDDSALLMITSILKYTLDNQFKKTAIGIIEKIKTDDFTVLEFSNLNEIMHNIIDIECFNLCEKEIFFNNITQYYTNNIDSFDILMPFIEYYRSYFDIFEKEIDENLINKIEHNLNNKTYKADFYDADRGKLEEGISILEEIYMNFDIKAEKLEYYLHEKLAEIEELEKNYYDDEGFIVSDKISSQDDAIDIDVIFQQKLR